MATPRPVVAALLLLATPWAAFGQPVPTDWKQIAKPPLRAFQPVSPRRIALGNGMVIFLQEDRELPLVQATLRIRGGSREEDAVKVGLVSVYGQAWRTGGTRKRTGDELDDYLEARAAHVETGGGLDSTTVSLNCLKENFADAFDVFLELLREPEFRPDKIELAQRQLHTGIARRNDNPQGILFRESAKLGYGAASPYARHPEYATIDAVTREDLLAWHRRYVHPGNMILGLVGDFDSKTMETTLRKAFASWPRGPAAAKVPEAGTPATAPGYYFIAKDDVNQSSIRMVHLGTTVDNPDYYAITVMNEVFGGSFAARLFTNVRSKKGLAYAVSGSVGTAHDHPGLFSVFTSTKSGTTAAAIDALYEEIDNLKKVPPTSEELQRARESLLNSFIFRVDSRAKVLFEKMTYEFYGYPLDFLERYPAAIEKVTAADVARAAQKYVDKGKLAVLVVGKAADFDRPLSSFGPVTTIDVTIPPP
ncbi:MAG: insulinase family protein [Acidobacteria bacterium]|nr:MAG: insulinase family protein [Acidobacteriota bacterium]